MNKIQFKTRKDVSAFLKERNIDTSNWSEEKWLKINKGQAEIHIMDLAEKIYDCYNESIPNKLEENQYHIPFKNEILSLFPNLSEENLLKCSSAMCARVSYTTVGEEKEINVENLLKIYDKLYESGHASPFEHIAKCDSSKINGSRNFNAGWLQYREEIEL